MSQPDQIRLLIVDDERSQLEALCSTLEVEGYVTTGFTDPRAALEEFGRRKFELVLTDLTMPGMDGIELLQAARRIDANVVGIVMTGHGSIDSAVAAMRAGALDYILKPFTLRMILPVIDRALTVRGLRTENTQLRQAEETIRRLNSNLERCVQERTRELTEANRELEAFSYSVSHDLRAPLRALDGFAKLLESECGVGLDPRGLGYVHRISEASARMRHLVDDLLRLSHVTGSPLAVKELNLSGLVRSITDELRSQESARSVDVKIAPNVVWSADESLLRIALENLLGNAWKFTRRTAHAWIEFDSQQRDGATIFTVADNGAGFEQKYADTLFAPFRRLHTTDEFPGTGIGLSIVQRIIRRHGGRIWAESAPGNGAKFQFTLGRTDSTPNAQDSGQRADGELVP